MISRNIGPKCDARRLGRIAAAGACQLQRCKVHLCIQRHVATKKPRPVAGPKGPSLRARFVHAGDRRRLVRRRARDSLNRLDPHGTDLVFRHLRGGVKRGIREPVGIAVLEMERHPCLTGICLARHARRSFDSPRRLDTRTRSPSATPSCSASTEFSSMNDSPAISLRPSVRPVMAQALY